MIVAVDVGNTNIVFGFIESRKVLNVFRISTDSGRTSDEYKILLGLFMKDEGIDLSGVEDFVISSVVPPLTPIFKTVAKKMTGSEGIIISSDLDTGIRFDVDEPKLTGTDRICNVFEAHRIFPKENAVVVDFGTATTFSVVTREGAFVGGPISIGIIAAATELFRKTSQLPRIELGKPRSIIGKNTVEEMQSGIVMGLGGMIDRLIEGIETELNEPVRAIATGGISHVMEGVSRKIEFFDKFLTLKGIYGIYERIKNS
ncbi:MAG: type III pantothenate kinase [Caldisericaceae bacterium]